jgi:SprT protein
MDAAQKHFGTAIAPGEIRFDLRGKGAGQFRSRDGLHCEIRFNRELLARNGERFLHQTVPHEVAHLVVFRLFGPGARPHGAEWQAIMRLFGAEPERCHDYDVEGIQTRRLRRYHYRCACRSHLLSSIRHNRVLRGQTYRCLACGQALQRSVSTPNPSSGQD